MQDKAGQKRKLIIECEKKTTVDRQRSEKQKEGNTTKKKKTTTIYQPNSLQLVSALFHACYGICDSNNKRNIEKDKCAIKHITRIDRMRQVRFYFFQQRLLVEKINQQLSEQIQLNLVQPTTATTTTTNTDVIKQIQVRTDNNRILFNRCYFLIAFGLPFQNQFANQQLLLQ